MERVSANPRERIGREPRLIHAPVILWLGSYPLVTYPGQQDGVPAISFAEAQGGKGYGTATATPVTLGRRFDNTLTFKNELTTISAIHTQISLQDNLWHVEDLGSTNGTFMEKIPTCPPGETLLPKGAWHLIPNGRDQQISLGSYSASQFDKNQVLSLSTDSDARAVFLTVPKFKGPTTSIMPLHRPLEIGNSATSDICIINNSVSPQHATLINTGNGVLIRDLHATGYTKVRIQPSI